MTARTRVWAIVGAVAAAAVAATLGAVALTADDERAADVAEPPPLFLDLGVREDVQARTLRRAATLYGRGDLSGARRLFDRFPSTEARVGAALATWPDSLRRLRALPQRSAVVRLHQGIVLATLGDERAARAELEAAARVEPDTPYAVRAGDFLHPRFAPGLPLFVTEQEFPRDLAGRSPAEQLALLARRRTRSGRLHYGTALQRVGMPLSARRAFDKAVRLAPGDAEALTAAAVARFDKDRPQLAFARLGPLARRFPRAQTVRFHLGLLLVWIGDVPDARTQFRRARALGPDTKLGREAKRFLDRL